MRGVKSAESEEEIVKFLTKILSPQEKINIEKRLAVLILLSQGESYRKISEIVDIQRATISSIKKEFKKIKKIKREKFKEKDNSLFGEFIKKENSIFPTSYSSKGRWKI